ncbi:MAG: ankyrin repeat domain-containing protein [Candidatus Thiodiazotropha sp. (ex Ctena orbiculata)]|nr:ankyrin repeat domain-containing protein [Candidatus Thiodiazotropha taylori]MBT3034264.1 ankyrin repeat domain-containing protein [Candidatus Thiodiazotropha taylori]MBV2136436.1 ankyrin repeat domain-containing protein [Candidatus Thiodiazotropha taylori]
MKLIHANPVRRSVCLLALVLLLSGCANDRSEEMAVDERPKLLIAAERGDLPTLTRLLESEPTIDVKDACLWTPLMKAALNGHYEAAKRLIQAGADVNQTDKGGYSSLMLAASNNHPDMVELLLESGAEIDQVETTKGWTALIWAAKLGHRDAVMHLLNYPVDRGIVDFSGKRALDWARENRFHEIAALLGNERLAP